MAACQPLNFFLRVSPTSSYSRTISPSLLPIRSPYGRLVTRMPVAAGGSASWKRPEPKVMYRSTRASRALFFAMATYASLISEATTGAAGAASFSARTRSCVARHRSRSNSFSHSK